MPKELQYFWHLPGAFAWRPFLRAEPVGTRATIANKKVLVPLFQKRKKGMNTNG